MVETDKPEFANIVKAVLDMKGKEISPAVLRLWWATMEEFSIEEVRHGFTRWLKSPDSGGFAPMPADIIRMIEGSSGDRGMLAWGMVMEAIKRVGGWQSVCFEDPIIHCIIEDMGGWPKLCSTDGGEMNFRAADFAKRYRAYAERGTPAHFAPYLTGRHETSNRIGGFKAPAPMMIGNPQKCAQVLAQGQEGPRTLITSADLVMGALAHANVTALLEDQGKRES